MVLADALVFILGIFFALGLFFDPFNTVRYFFFGGGGGGCYLVLGMGFWLKTNGQEGGSYKIFSSTSRCFDVFLTPKKIG